MNGTHDTAILIAGISLGVSFATFMWRIVYDLAFDRPRVKVRVVEGSMGVPPNLVPTYIVTATNVGRRPTTLQSLWLCFGRPWPRLSKLLGKKLAKRWFSISMIQPDAPSRPRATQIPVRLEPGDEAQVFYARDDARESLKDRLPVKLFGRAWTTHGHRNSRRLRVKP